MSDNHKHALQLEHLIQTAIEVGGHLNGKTRVKSVPDLIYAEGLGKKIISHALSIRLLFNGYSLSIGKNNYAPHVDFSSINVLTRAAIETYLTLNYIYVFPKNQSEKEFKFMCWDLGGYLERSKFPTKSEEHKQRKESEAQAILDLKKQIREHEFFKTIDPDFHGQPLGGQWKLSNSWTTLAVQAGFSEQFFNKQYKYLCGYAHSSRLSIIQIRDCKELKTQEDMANPTISVLMTVLAKFIHDYIIIFPELKEHVDLKNDKYMLVRIWKEIGEQFDQNK